MSKNRDAQRNAQIVLILRLLLLLHNHLQLKMETDPTLFYIITFV